VAVEKALAVVDACLPGLLRDLKSQLDSYHGVSRSAEYYDLLAGEWLMHFVHATYAAYADAMVDMGSVEQIEAPVVPVFADFGEYMQAAAGGPAFGEILYGQVRHALAHADLGLAQFTRSACRVGSQSAGIASRIKRGLKGAALSTLGRKDAPFVICNPYFRGEPSDWVATLWKWRRWARQDDFRHPVEAQAEVDVDWRLKHATATRGTGFADVVRALIPLNVPVVYLEAFAAYRQKAQALRLHRPQVLYTANSLFGHTLFKLLAADWREEGTKVLNHQHGGGFGIDRVHPIEDYETRVADRFYTWGWTGSSPDQVPLVAPLSASQFPGTRGPGRILLNCISYPGCVYRIHFQPMPGTIETMVANSVAFVRGMRGQTGLVLRPYFADNGLGLTETLQRANPEVRLDDLRNTGVKSYARSGLVVHSYLGTSWLETLAMNIPTVCFYDQATYAFRDAVRPHIDALAAAGILHTSGHDAADFVKKVMGDPQGWWLRKEVQDARRAFVARYANFSAAWAGEWEAEFRQWID